MTELIIRPYDPTHCSRWDAFVNLSKNGTFLIQRGFLEYHSDRFVDASTLVTDPSDNIIALFPANRSGTRVSSHAGLSYGGMICDARMGAPLALDVFAIWLNHWRNEGASEVIYKAIPPIYHRMPADEDRYAIFYHGGAVFRRDVASVIDFEAQGPVQERRRRGMKKARQAGLSFQESSDLAAFWDLLAENLSSRHGTQPVHSLEELALLQERFPRNILLFGVYDGNNLRAATLLFCCERAVHAQYIASSENGRAQGALDLLFSCLIEAFRGTVRYFDFGNSNEDDGKYLNRGLIEFKEGFGARSIIQDFFRIDLAAWGARSAA